MIDITDFIKTYYPGYPELDDNTTVAQFEDYKDRQDIEGWDYPLEEYDHISSIHNEDGTEYVSVRFSNGCGDYDYRFCEIPSA